MGASPLPYTAPPGSGTFRLTEPPEAVLAKSRELRTAKLARVWPAAEEGAASSDHAPLVELIKVYTAIQAIDFAIANRPDPNLATRTRMGF